MTHSFGTKASFSEVYEKMHRGFENAENVSLGGPVFNADLAESCDIMHDGRVLESWARE